MPRYIDADLLMQKLSRMIDYCEKDQKVNGLTALFQVGDAIMDCPTADVAPKIEVAREIFKEIRELVKPITKVIYHGEVIYESPISLNEIEKKYTEGKT
ncbi:MAG: hypothetical protein U0K81_01110 [Paludibacteraceae bacterium]|nr:hypothetical protein [Paludibacteraceae bacterium]